LNKYVAFLRGINVGGHKTVKMDALKKAFEIMGFSNVKTLLASGNVLFDTAKASESTLASQIEKTLEKTFGHEIGVLVRTVENLQKLADHNPFAGVKVTPQTRLYVTFLSENPNSNLKIPYKSPDGNFKIIQASSSEVCSVATLSPNSRTVDLMSILEKEYGKRVTTRNWNTIERILRASELN
jgi:uncharacterized protein (DUF1697 family)